MAVSRRSSPRFGAMLLIAFLGLAAGYFLITTTSVEARTPRGPSARDILEKAEAIEEQEVMIADLIARAEILGGLDACMVDVDINADCSLACDSDCCFPNGSTGCDDRDCQEAVCGFDPFCCETEWDGLCAGEAEENCGDLCVGCDEPNDVGACCFISEGPDCALVTEEECVEGLGGEFQGGDSCDVCFPE